MKKLQGIEPRKGIATSKRPAPRHFPHPFPLQGIEPRKGIATCSFKLLSRASWISSCCKGLSPVRGLRRLYRLGDDAPDGLAVARD